MRTIQILLLLFVAMLLPLRAGQQQASKANEWDGEVQSYEPGNLLTVRKMPRVEVKFDLTKRDAVYEIPPDLAKFTKVHVVEQDKDSMHYVTVTVQDKGSKKDEKVGSLDPLGSRL